MNTLVDFAARVLHMPARVIRFLVSGGTVALIELVLLYLFTDIVGLWYEFSFGIAFVVAFCVSFALQKFWTFEDHDTEDVHKQASLYFFVTIANALINAVALYVLVEYAHLWYLLAQIIINAALATGSFLIYKFIIFKKSDIVASS